MATTSSAGNSTGKSEKLSLLALGLCVVALVVILVLRPF
jgi:hypothetical protein